jgi:hypothetical protein
MVDISAGSQNCAWWILVCGTKVLHASYWHDKEVIHGGFKVREARFTL